MATEIDEKIDKITELVTNGQEKFTELEAQGKTASEGFEKMALDVGTLSEELQGLKLAAEAGEKARQDLEAIVARMPEKAADGTELKGSADYRKAFELYLRKGEYAYPTSELLATEADMLAKSMGMEGEEARELKALVVGSQPDLGFTVPIDAMRFIVDRIFETSAMRSVATVITTAREAVSVMIDDQEPSSSWVAETDDVGDTTTPQVAELTIPTHEQQAQPKVTLKMLEDSSINIESWLNGKISGKFARQENTGFVLGTGIKQATGLMTKTAWTDNEEYERGKVARQVTAASNALDGDDLIALQTLLLEGYQPNARWLMHRQTWGLNVLTLKDTTDQYLINPQLLFQGVDFQLLGKPVTLMGDMAAGVTVDNALIMAYGDFREAYTIVDRLGIQILRDPFTAKGFVKFFTRKRVGGDVTNYQAYKILEVKA